MKQTKGKKAPAAAKSKTAKTKKSQAQNDLWGKVVVRAAALPGYGVLFVGWSFLAGLSIAGLYTLFFDSFQKVSDSTGRISRAGEAGSSEWLMMVVLGLFALCGVAYFVGKGLRWLAPRLHVRPGQSVHFKVILVTTGWLLLAVVGSVAFSQHDYIVLFASGLSIAVGSLSFVLEKFLLDFLKLSQDDTW